MPIATGEGTLRALAAAPCCWPLAVVAAGLCCWPGVAAAAGQAGDTRVEATLDRDEIAVDESAVLTVRVESSEQPEGVEFPKGLPFSVVSRGQSSGSSMSLGSGGMAVRRTLVMTFELAPKTTGDLAIPPITAVVGGKRFSSEALVLKVVPAGSRPRPPPPAAPQPGPQLSPFGAPRGTWHGWERDLRLLVELDRSEAFLGEPVVATVWVVSPVQVVDVGGLKEPTFDGFWREGLELPNPLPESHRVIDGITYRTYLLDRVALVPTRAGELTIRPFEAMVQVRVGTSSPFDPFPEIRSARLKTQPRTVTVKPLPAGAPPGFANVNVGKLELEARASETAVAAGQPVTIRVTARGEGNLRALSLPAVPDIPGVRRFEPTSSENVQAKAARLGGSRTVETVLVPERPGELVVPALAWPVFDPAKGTYQTLRTTPLRVQVGPSTAEPSPAAAAGTNPLTAGLRPIRSDPTLRAAAPPPWRGPGFLALLAGPALGYAGLAVALRLRERSAATAGVRRTRGAGRTARRRLRAARKALARGEREAFLAEVERALQGYAGDRLGQPVGSLTREALAGALGRAGAHGPSVNALDAALAACDAARYGRGGGHAGDDALLASAEKALSLLDQADWTDGSGRAA